MTIISKKVDVEAVVVILLNLLFWKPRDCSMRKELTSVRDHEVASVRRYMYLENNTVAEMASRLL